LSNYGAFLSAIQPYIITVIHSVVKSIAKLTLFMRVGFTSLFSARQIDKFEDVFSSFECDGPGLWQQDWIIQSWGKFRGKEPFGGPRSREEDNIKIDLQ
jgi:hypothetical protein